MEHILTTSEMDTFMDITFLFNSMLDITMLSGKFLQMLGKIVPYEKAVMMLYHNTRQKLIPCAELRCDKTLVNDYISKYHVMDYLGWHIYQSGAGIVRESDKMPGTEREESIFFKEFMKKYDIQYRIMFNMESSGGALLGAVMLFRSAVFTDFTDREMGILQMLRHHFAAAIEHSIRFEQLKQSSKLAQTVYHDVDEVILVLNSDFEIRYKNEKSERFLKMLRQKASDYEDFFSAIKTACLSIEKDEIKERTVHFKLYCGTAKVSLIPTNAMMARAPYEFVVVYSDMRQQERILFEKKPELSEEEQTESRAIYYDRFLVTLGEQYNLTKRECNLIGLALDGLENKDIAEQLYISLFTVKSHFQNSYTKLGIKSRQELFRLYMNYSISKTFRQEFDDGTREGEIH